MVDRVDLVAMVISKHVMKYSPTMNDCIGAAIEIVRAFDRVDAQEKVDKRKYNILVETLSEIKAVSDNFGRELELIDGNKIPADNSRIQDILEKCLCEIQRSD